MEGFLKMDTRIDIEYLLIVLVMLIPTIVSIISFYIVYKVRIRYKIFKSGTKDENM